MKVMEALEKALKWYCESAQTVYTPSDWNNLSQLRKESGKH